MNKKVQNKLLITFEITTILTLIGSALVSFDVVSNETNYNANILTKNNVLNKPSIPQNGVIDLPFIMQLTAYKKNLSSSWNGSFLESDFEGATSILQTTFWNNHEIKSINLPLTVTSVGANAFLGAANLTTITALGVGDIGYNAFLGTSIVKGGIKLTKSTYLDPTNYSHWGLSDQSKIIISDINKPTITTDGIITSTFVNKLIAYKKNQDTTWNKRLDESDFEGATSVATSAFWNRSEIISIVLPDTVLTIGANAFSGATNLNTISALGVTSIGDGAFNSLDNMWEMGIQLTYSENIKKINMLNWGGSLKYFNIDNSPSKPLLDTKIIDAEFVNLLVEYKKSLNDDVHIWNGKLEESDFEGGIAIGENAFQNQIEVKSIALPTSVKIINANAFSGATNLTTISALGATSISADAFAETTAIIPQGIKLTESTNINVDQATVWGIEPNRLFITNINPPKVPIDGVITTAFVNELITYKKDIIGGYWDGSLVESDFEGATSIAQAAFYTNTEIKSITLPSTVTSIGHNAFAGASNLTTISALGATSIGDGAFYMVPVNPGFYYQIQLRESANVKMNLIERWGIHDKRQISIFPSSLQFGSFIITADFIKKLSDYKRSLNFEDPNSIFGGYHWDGETFTEDDFIGAISVADRAFLEDKKIKSITLPASVKEIGESAFNSTPNLETVSALGATRIGYNAFYNTPSINGEWGTGINLTYSEFISFGKGTDWGITPTKLHIINHPRKPLLIDETITFEFITKLSSYKKSIYHDWRGTFDSSDFRGATSVAEAAFQNNTQIWGMTLPNTVKSIGANAFNGVSSLRSIFAPGVTSIGTNAFAGMSNITGIGDDKINLTYSENINVDQAATWGIEPHKLDIVFPPKILADGIITPKFVNQLIDYKKTRISNWDYTLVESDFEDSTSVAEGAFWKKNRIKSIILPETVISIGANAFSGASALTNISALGATSIGTSALDGTISMLDKGIKLTGNVNITTEQFINWGTTPNKLDISIFTPPIIPENGIIDSEYITKLITYKKDTITNWDGSLVESDFTNTNSIANAAFQNNKEVKSVTLPSTILKIGNNTFNGASALTTISALGATSIGAGAFAGMTSIANKGIKLTGSENITIDKANSWGVTVDKLDIEIIPSSPGFFDDTNNIIIVACAGGGLLLLIGGIVTGVLVYKKKKNANDLY